MFKRRMLECVGRVCLLIGLFSQSGGCGNAPSHHPQPSAAMPIVPEGFWCGVQPNGIGGYFIEGFCYPITYVGDNCSPGQPIPDPTCFGIEPDPWFCDGMPPRPFSRKPCMPIAQFDAITDGAP